MSKIKIKELAENRSFLSGLFGRHIYPILISRIDKQIEPTRIFLDFEGVSASGSFFSQAILPLRKFARRMDAYLVLCNLDEESKEELRWLLDVSPDAVFICNINDDEIISNVEWIGNLEEKQRLTLEAVGQWSDTDAASLSKKYEDIKATGWNNRLVALSEKGLLMEFRSGRSKRYRPVLEI